MRSQFSVEEVLEEARARGWKIVVAESCTGGLLGATLTEVPGSSDVFEAGFVTYSNAAKQSMLSVLEGTLIKHGAVSQAVARQMAAGAITYSAADISVAITGVAGPGATGDKPEGRVCFAVAAPDYTFAETVEFGPIGRIAVRNASVDHALSLLMDAMVQE
ncbi:MAG: CinA family protein [Paracoccaceae bacterium]